jgi:hypothetical protein
MQLEPRSLMRLGKSQALPLPPTHIIRTESELQMEDNAAEAEWRDYCMFQRIMVGISNNQRKMYETLYHLQNENGFQENIYVDSVNEAIVSNQKCLDHIARTRRRHSMNTNPTEDPNHRYYLESTMVQESKTMVTFANLSQTITTPPNVRKVSSGNYSSSSSDMENIDGITSEQDFFHLDL